MKMSNFKLVRKDGKSAVDWVFFGTVDVTTGHLWWKKTERKEIRRKYIGFWHFVDNGRFLSDEIYRLTRSWEAKNGELL